MYGKNFLFVRLILLTVLFLPVTGCWPPGEVKFVNNRWVLCPEETLVGDHFTWGIKMFQPALIEPGLFKFKFDVSPVNSSLMPPTEYRLDFKYLRKKQLLFAESLDVFTRPDGSIPFHSFDFFGLETRKNDRAIFDLYPLDRDLPLSNVGIRFKYNRFNISALSSFGINLPPHPMRLIVFQETEYIRRAK